MASEDHMASQSQPVSGPSAPVGSAEPSGANQFRKRPVVVEAVRFHQIEPLGVPSFTDVPAWLGQALCADVGCIVAREPGVLAIDTLEGVMEAQPGDWIIRGIRGELYPCKPDIFAATYERVE